MRPLALAAAAPLAHVAALVDGVVPPAPPVTLFPFRKWKLGCTSSAKLKPWELLDSISEREKESAASPSSCR
jgi:hypothetical protein